MTPRDETPQGGCIGAALLVLLLAAIAAAVWQFAKLAWSIFT